MTLPKTLGLIWRETPGPKTLVVVMTAVVGLAHGLVLAVVNDAIEARMLGTLTWLHGAAFVGALLVYVIGAYFALYRATAMTRHLIHRLRGQLLQRLSHAGLRAVEVYGPGEITAHITSDILTIGNAALRGAKTVQSIVVCLFCLVYLGWLSPTVLLVGALTIGLGVMIYLAREKTLAGLLKTARSKEAVYYGDVAGALDGAKETRLNRHVEADVVDALDRQSDEVRLLQARAEYLLFTNSTISNILLFLMLGIVAVVPADFLGAGNVSSFQIVAVMIFMLGPLENIVDFLGPYSRADVARRNLESFSDAMAAGAEPSAKGAPGETTALVGPIRFEGVSFRHTDDADAFELGPLDLDVAQGKMTFIVGGNGSGKTTLMKLIAGLYVPTHGAVRIGDAVIDDATREAQRAGIAAVFHDFHIFPDIPGVKPLPVDALRANLAHFGLAHKVKVDENGFDTVDLSTGQRKRLALVAALAHKRPLLLMDEFGAEQDPAFRHDLYQRFLPEMRDAGMTIVAVTHDDQYFGLCDSLIKLDAGGIVYQGPPSGFMEAR